MTDEILVNVIRREVRVAFLSQGAVREIHVERRIHQSVTGNIYLGRVRRLLPGLQAAFIDMGLGRPGFLHAKDIHADCDISFENRQFSLSLGDRLPVQVIKDPLGSKGARVTTHFTLPGRLLVFTPGVFRITTSKKITDSAAVSRLLTTLVPGRLGGFIFRTVAVHASKEELLAEQHLLESEWDKILVRMKTAKLGDCLHTEPSLECRILRDLVGRESSIKIHVDDQQTLKKMQNFASIWCPAFLNKMTFYADLGRPLFEHESVETKLNQALLRKVYLKSGGYLVFDQTEAMTTIDVNTGSTLNLKRTEDAIFRTNQEAVAVIAQQVRLRNLGGIIIIDFIDMVDGSQRELLKASLVAAFADDTAHTEFSELTRLGLVQMTRKRARESLLHTLCEPCPLCHRRGMIRTAATVAHDIIRSLQSMSNRVEVGFRVQAAPDVAGYFLEFEPDALTNLETQICKTIELCPDARYKREVWDILPIPNRQKL